MRATKIEIRTKALRAGRHVDGVWQPAGRRGGDSDGRGADGDAGGHDTDCILRPGGSPRNLPEHGAFLADPVTPLSLTDPMASLIAVAGLTYKAIGARREPPVDQPAVSHAVRLCARVKLSTLAAYARAAGRTLTVQCDEDSPCGRWNVSADSRGAGVTVGELRDALAALGFTMTMGVEPLRPEQDGMQHA